MTTLAIIGSGIVGRSLLYTLVKEKISFEKITLFQSDTFTRPCTFTSTAVVAPRGVSPGRSALGDLLIDGFREFSCHFLEDSPDGVSEVLQYTGATDRLDHFKLRYPAGKLMKDFFRSETYVATDKAFIIDPMTYQSWLLAEAQSYFGDRLEIVDDLVLGLEIKEKTLLHTHGGLSGNFDKVVVAGGVYNRFWSGLFPESHLSTSKPVQGAYLEWNDVDFPAEAFSLTLNGDNLIWNQSHHRLLIGSTSDETNHFLPDMEGLLRIYNRLQEATLFSLPSFQEAEVKIGLREKARKREPYMIKKENVFFIGGVYKNGFTLSLKISKNFSRQYL